MFSSVYTIFINELILNIHKYNIIYININFVFFAWKPSYHLYKYCRFNSLNYIHRDLQFVKSSNVDMDVWCVHH